MPPLASALLQTGLALKLNQVKRATSSYVRDRSEQTQGIAVLLCGRCRTLCCRRRLSDRHLAGGRRRAVSLGRTALRAVSGLWRNRRTAAGARCALRRPRGESLEAPTKQFPSLGSRLRVAINASPGKHEQVTSAAPHRAPAPNEFRPSTRFRTAPAEQRPGESRTGARRDACRLGFRPAPQPCAAGPCPQTREQSERLMAVRRSDTDSLLLVAATTFAVLALQSFSRRAPQRSVVG